MHVKLENSNDFDDFPSMDFCNIKDVETNFRIELFGNHGLASDFSESSSSHSDEGLTTEQLLLGDYSSGIGTGSATSSRSSSTSFDQLSSDFNLHNFYKDDDEELRDTICVDPTNLEACVKEERHSPESSFIDNETADQIWKFLNDENTKSNVPESPPLTPPNGSPSPPLSPASITTHEGLNSSSIPTTAVITLTQVDSRRASNAHQGAPLKVVASAKDPLRKSVSRNIQIQPRVCSRNYTQKPMIKMENGTPKVSLAPIASKVAIHTRAPLPKPIIITPQHSNFVPTAFTIPDSTAQTCSLVSERKTILPPLAPALNPSLKNNDGIAEIQAMKRQERMIKNRESASLSRKRKKEYLQNLEDKINFLERENTGLKEDNLKLRKRLSSYEQERSILKRSFPLKRTSSAAFLGVTFLLMFNLNSIGNVFKHSGEPSFLPEHSNLGDKKSPLLETNFDHRFSQRSLLWFSSEEENNGNFSTICPLHINATESIRIENELRDWFETRLESTNREWSSKPIEMKKKKKNLKPSWKSRRKMADDRALTATPHKDPVASGPTDVYRYISRADKVSQDLIGVESFLRTFERRNDTYYVVALSSHHILLPASAHNTSARPKMSLLVPTSRALQDPLLDHQMMQIDCEVTRTKLVRFDEGTPTPTTTEPPPLRESFAGHEEAVNASIAEKGRKKMHKTRFSRRN